MSLLDDLQKKPVIAPQAGLQEQAQNLLRTKLTGKADQLPSAVPGRYDVGQEAAKEQGESLGAQLQKEATFRAGQIEQDQRAQEQQAQLDKQQQQQSLASKVEAFHQQQLDMVDQYARGQKEVNSLRDIANIEQVGALARLNNAKYVEELENIGTRERLDDDARWKEAYYNQLFSDNAELAKLARENEMAAVKRGIEQRNILADIDLSSAERMADIYREQAAAEVRARNYQAGVQAVGGLISGGMETMASATKSSVAPAAPKPGG